MKRLFIFAGVLASIGLLLGFFGLILLDFDFTKLDRMDYEARVYEITEDFSEIHMDLDTADVRFVLAEDGVCRVECMEAEKLAYTVEVKEGSLNIVTKDSRKWYDYIGVFNSSHPMTVYLPKAQYDHLSIDVSTGDVQIPDGFTFGKLTLEGSTGDVSFGRVSVNSMDIRVSTGDIELTGVRATNMTLKVSTGEISLSDVRTEESLSVETSTGDVTLSHVISYGMTVECTTGDVSLTDCNAFSIKITTTTGDIEGTLLQEKWFVTETTTGSVNVPASQGMQGGYCYLTTTTGDIDIRLS